VGTVLKRPRSKRRATYSRTLAEAFAQHLHSAHFNEMIDHVMTKDELAKFRLAD
jgi:hypothetical protein